MASVISWFKKHVEHPVGSFVSNDIVHPIGHAATSAVHGIAGAANSVAHAVNNDIIHPVENFGGDVFHTVQQAPQVVNHNIFQPVEQRVVKPLFQLPSTVGNDFKIGVNQFGNNVGNSLENTGSFLNQHLMPGAPSVTSFLSELPGAARTVAESPARIPLGNGVTTGSFVSQIPKANAEVFSGPARSAIGTAQGLSGLYDMATQGTLHPQQSSFDKLLDNRAKELDTFANQNVNPYYYHGSQLATDLGTFAIPGAGEGKIAAKVGEYAPKVVKVADKLPSVEKGVARLTSGLDKGNFSQRVAGRAIRNVANPKYQLANAAFTGLQAGKNASTGEGNTIPGLLTNAALGGLGFPVAGAAGSEAARGAINLADRGVIEPLARNTVKVRGTPQGTRYLSNLDKNGNLRTRIAPPDARRIAANEVGTSLKDIGKRAKQFSKAHPVGGSIKPINGVDAVNIDDYITDKAPRGIDDRSFIRNAILKKFRGKNIHLSNAETAQIGRNEAGKLAGPGYRGQLPAHKDAKINSSMYVDELGATMRNPHLIKNLKNPKANAPALLKGDVTLISRGKPYNAELVIRKYPDGTNRIYDIVVPKKIAPSRVGVSADHRVIRDDIPTVAKNTPKVKSSTPLADLKQEALKYKSADEFVKAQGKPVYHGTDSTFSEFNPALSNSSSGTGVGKGHLFFTDDTGVARSYGKNVLPASVSIKKPLIIDADGMPWDEINFRGSGYNQTINNIAKVAQKEGYDGLIVKNVRDTGSKLDKPGGFRTSTATVVFDKNQVKTHQQLTDLYNQAHAEAKTSKLAPKANSPREIGKALGLTDKQMAEANRAERERQQVSEVLSSRLPLRAQPRKISQSESRPQSHQSSPGKGSSGREKIASSGGKYTTNATKVNIAEVKPGDYEKVRSNAQLVQTVVHNHAQSVIHALRQLSTPERSEFWHKVEDPNLPRSAKMQTAIDRWQRLANTVHATSHALGGDTPYRVNYARHNWDLSDPAQRELYEQLLKQRVSDTNYNPENFKGLDNKPRAFDTIKEGEAAGFKLKNDNPVDDIVDYANKSKRQLKTQAVAKGMQEAEENIPLADKSETQSIGYKKSIETTKQGVKELRALFPPPKSDNGLLKGYRSLNHGAKRVLLGISQFHPININMQAAPALALRGHPIMAVRGLIDSAATLNKNYSDKIMENALKDGTMEDAARIGAPIATGSDFATGNKVDLKAGFGERAVFERQLPAMHIQMVKGVVADLKKRGISLDSPEARKAGTEINQIMGYVNTELRNLSPTVQRGLGDVALAPQFTRSKWEVLGDAFNPKNAGTLQGKYARDAVIGKYAAEAAITLALGALLGQKSDNITDSLIRTFIHPSVPTPFKDKKGNTIELGLPQNYLSEAAGLVLNYTRGKNGRLGITASPGGIPSNLKDYGKNRLAILPNDTLKVLTNTDFADKPLYNPTSSADDKIAQGATTLLTGHLPIGLQGLAYTKAVNKHLPQNIQDVLNNASPGSNPILKSVGSSFGLNPRTDKTVGKGLSTTRYFGALDEAKRGLNRQAADAIDIYTGGKKNSVTGKYDITPNANDSRAKATVLLQNPSAIDHLIKMNQKLAKEGEKVDPLWLQTKAHITKYLQYQAMPPASADKTDWNNKNKWYGEVAKQRNAFFSSLPPGDPNKPKNPYEYPEADAKTQKDMDTYYSLTSPDAKGAFLDNHPNLIKQWDAIANYNNELRAAQGYAPLKNYPEPDADTQKFMDTYNAADKATRKSIRNANPTAYRKMIAFYDKLDLYNINKQGALSQLRGEPDYTNKSAKAIKNIGEDFYVDQYGNYHLIPAGWMLGLGSGGYGSSGTSPTSAKLKFDMAKQPLKIVGALPTPTKSSAPTFRTPPLKTVYNKQTVNTHPKSSLTKVR